MATNPNTIFSSENLLTGRTQIESSFGANSDDFTIDSNNVLNLKNKTSYWSCTGNGFQPPDQSKSFTTTAANRGTLYFQSATNYVRRSVELPHGAVITEVIVYGTDGGGDVSTPQWRLCRYTLADQTNTEMATNTWNTADSTISNATIDNSTYGYFLEVEGLDDDMQIYGAIITYTTDYD